MIKKYILIVAAVFLVFVAASPLSNENTRFHREIKRLTYSGNNVVHYPCLSDDGRWMLYILEIKDGDQSTKTLMVMNVEDGKERELYRDGEKKALPPFNDVSLILGSKPPLLSGDGRKAVFSLSLSKPINILDHYLAVVNTDGTDFWVTKFPIDVLQGKNIESLDFTSSDWERVSNYAVNNDGTRIACVLKGHLGPTRYGNPSGIVFLDVSDKKQRTILSPDFDGKQWNWPSSPHHPLLGGGWAFAMSGNGQKIVFGAKSSTDKIDYDLYITDWDGKETKRITDFHDRWFSLADISHDGEKIAFFYNGSKKQGIGTYVIHTDDSEPKYLKSKLAPQIELFDMSGDGRYILFKHIYKGMIFDLETGVEIVAFDAETKGYVKGLIPMDFPRIPSFWAPRIMSFKGDRILLAGSPQGKETPEIHVLIIERR